jgi:hypothetical protein
MTTGDVTRVGTTGLCIVAEGGGLFRENGSALIGARFPLPNVFLKKPNMRLDSGMKVSAARQLLP